MIIYTSVQNYSAKYCVLWSVRKWQICKILCYTWVDGWLASSYMWTPQCSFHLRPTSLFTLSCSAWAERPNVQGVTRERGFSPWSQVGGAVGLLSNTLKARFEHANVGISMFLSIPNQLGSNPYMFVCKTCNICYTTSVEHLKCVFWTRSRRVMACSGRELTHMRALYTSL